MRSFSSDKALANQPTGVKLWIPYSCERIYKAHTPRGAEAVLGPMTKRKGQELNTLRND